jgi:hypothetical protein
MNQSHEKKSRVGKVLIYLIPSSKVHNKSPMKKKKENRSSPKSYYVSLNESVQIEAQCKEKIEKKIIPGPILTKCYSLNETTKKAGPSVSSPSESFEKFPS